MNWLVFDVEANDLLPGLTTFWCIGIADAFDYQGVDIYTDQDDEYPPISEGIERLKNCDKAIAHNGMGYDYWAIEKIYPGTFDSYERIWDSVAMSQLLFPERQSHALESWGNEFKMPKGDFKDFSQFSREMLPYLERDVEITYKVFHHFQNRFQWFFENHQVDYRRAIKLEHAVQYCLSLQAQHGFRLDVDKARELDDELSEELNKHLQDLQKIFPPMPRPEKADWDFDNRRWTYRNDPKSLPEAFTPKGSNSRHGYVKDAPLTKVIIEQFNPGSTSQIARRLSKAFGWKPVELTKTGAPKMNDETLQGLEYPEAVAIRRYLRLTKMLGMLATGDNAWLKMEKDGYVHGYVKSCGARTHRMSHNRPNMAQVDKKDHRMREVWLPDPGHVLVGCDAASLELRIMAHYLEQWDAGSYIKTVLEGDPHQTNMDIVGVADRNLIKTWFYALIYGAGDLTLGLTIIEDLRSQGKPIERTPRSYGKKSRELMESGLEGYAELVKYCRDRDKNQGFVILPDGRPARTNGGHSAANTQFQGAGAIVMKEALRIFHFENAPKANLVDANLIPMGWAYCANVHDELQMSAEPGIAELLGTTVRQSIIDAGESLGIACPMDGEFMIGNNWAETH